MIGSSFLKRVVQLLWRRVIELTMKFVELAPSEVRSGAEINRNVEGPTLREKQRRGPFVDKIVSSVLHCQIGSVG